MPRGRRMADGDNGAVAAVLEAWSSLAADGMRGTADAAGHWDASVRPLKSERPAGLGCRHASAPRRDEETW